MYLQPQLNHRIHTMAAQKPCTQAPWTRHALPRRHSQQRVPSGFPQEGMRRGMPSWGTRRHKDWGTGTWLVLTIGSGALSIAMYFQLYVRIHPCAQGRCNRCPPGSGVMVHWLILFFCFLFVFRLWRSAVKLFWGGASAQPNHGPERACTTVSKVQILSSLQISMQAVLC